MQKSYWLKINNLQMKKNVLLIFVFFLSINSWAQNYDLGKVSIEELQEKKHPLDSSAAAAILFKTGKTYFDIDPEGYFVLINEVKFRVKIYKKEGYEYSTVEMPYYKGGKQVRLRFDDAVTYNLVGDKIEKTKLKSDGEFEEKFNEDYNIKKITLPNVKEGSVIEYKYTLRTPYYSFFPDWYFQYSIPVNHVEYDVRIPQYFTYRRFLKGFSDVKASKEEVVMGMSRRYNESKVIYTVDNVKALKAEPYVNNMENYTSMLQYELASTSFPNSGITNYATDWQSVAKTIYEHEDFGDELNRKSYFEEDIDALVKGVVARDEKINIIFDYVKSRMNWNEKNSYYCDAGVKKAYAEKVGNVAEINLMLVAMLRHAQINANPVLVSTRSNGIALYPNRGAYNYVIAAVELENNKQIFLDATTKNALPNLLPIRVLNWNGRLIRENKTSEEVDLMPKINSKEVINVLASIDAEGNVSGKARDQYFDYNSYIFRENYLSVAKDSYIESLEKRYDGLEIGEYSVANEKELSKPIVETFDFTNSNLVEKIGDKIYFSPMLYYVRKENPFKEEVRQFPVDFIFPYQDKYTFTISIPEGYVVESVPTPLSIAMEENIALFKYNITNSGSQIQLAIIFDMNYSNIPSDYYLSLKDFYKKMIEKQNEKIVLKKV